MNRTPKRIYRDEHLNMRIPGDVKQKLKELAEVDHMTMSEWIVEQIKYCHMVDFPEDYEPKKFKSDNPYQE